MNYLILKIINKGDVFMINKEVATIKYITKNLIICFICYSIILEFFIGSYISNSVSSLNLYTQVTVYLIYQTISIFLIWKFVFKKVMKNCIIKKDDINIILRNILIFCIIIFCIYLLITSPNIKKNINYNVDILSKDMTSEIYEDYLNGNETLKNYNSKIQDITNSAKNKVYFIVFFKYFCFFIIFIGIGYFQKKELLKRAI